MSKLIPNWYQDSWLALPASTPLRVAKPPRGADSPCQQGWRYSEIWDHSTVRVCCFWSEIENRSRTQENSARSEGSPPPKTHSSQVLNFKAQCISVSWDSFKSQLYPILPAIFLLFLASFRSMSPCTSRAPPTSGCVITLLQVVMLSSYFTLPPAGVSFYWPVLYTHYLERCEREWRIMRY